MTVSRRAQQNANQTVATKWGDSRPETRRCCSNISVASMNKYDVARKRLKEYNAYKKYIRKQYSLLVGLLVCCLQCVSCRCMWNMRERATSEVLLSYWLKDSLARLV